MTTVHESAATAASTELSVWPVSSTEPLRGDLAVGGVSLAEIADRFGTPVYVLDEAEVRERCRTYRRAFPDAEVLYAAEAFMCRAVVHWIDEEGLGLDVCSAGELELAVTTGFPPERITLHGNAKSPRDLDTALRLGVGRIVIDSPSEIARLARAVGPDGHQKAMVRVVPGISAGGHGKIRTGTDDQKFGLSIADGYAQHAIARMLDQPQLERSGLHCHLGSQITIVKPYLAAIRRMVGLMARLHEQHGLVLPELDLGGAHGIAYRPGERALDLTSLARKVRTELADACATAALPVPRLIIEPGRAIAGPAGIALYRVLSVKRSGGNVFVAVDGGMSDNPRPALYGVRYAPRLVRRHSTGALVPRVHLPVSLAGPAPSGSSGASRRCRGCSPPDPADSPGPTAPCFCHPAATGRRRGPHTRMRITAPRGARSPTSTRTGSASRRKQDPRQSRITWASTPSTQIWRMVGWAAATWSAMWVPAVESWMLAAVTSTASSSPRVSVTMLRLRPTIFFAVSVPMGRKIPSSAERRSSSAGRSGDEYGKAGRNACHEATSNAH